MCKCNGQYHENWQNWAVVQRRNRPETCLLRCLACRHEWRSKAKYTILLPDWLPRLRRSLSQSEILQRIENGTLVVDTENAVVWSLLRNGIRSELRVIERENESSNVAYRFVEISSDGGKRKIAMHRLVWIAANRRTIPDGYHVDHISGSSDSIGNLRLLKNAMNCATNGARKILPDDYREEVEMNEGMPF